MRSSQNRAIILAMSGTLLLFGGCSRHTIPAPPADEVARQALTQALDAWKAGESPEQLASASTPIRVLDNDWSKGSTLLAYTLVGDGQLLGHALQQTVALELKPAPSGNPLKRMVNYTVAATPNLIVARQDLDE